MSRSPSLCCEPLTLRATAARLSLLRRVLKLLRLRPYSPLQQRASLGSPKVCREGTAPVYIKGYVISLNVGETALNSDSEDMPPVTPRRKPSSRVRNVVLSSDSESEDAPEEYVDFDDTPAKRTPGKRRHPIDESDVIDLTLTSPESEGEEFAVPVPGNSTPTKKKLARSVPKDVENIMPLFLDDSGPDEDEAPRFNDPFSVDDGSILILYASYSHHLWLYS